MLTLALTGVHSVIRTRLMRRDPERVLIVGAGETGQAIARSIGGSSARDAVVVGFVDDDPLPRQDDLASLPVFPANDQLVNAVRESGAERILLAFSRMPASDVLERVRASSSGDIPISVVPRFYEITPLHASLSTLGGTTVVDLASASLSRGARISKRALDLAIGGVALVLLSPVMLACAIAIKLDSRGPVFFRQERLGYRGQPFQIIKFRSMRTDAEARRQAMADMNEMENSGPLFKIKSDPRVTGVGQFLRKTSLDELPQLFNVMGGTMSLVGPRPFVTHEAVQITGWHARRLDIVPGITGLWQMKGRNDIPFDEMVRLDYQYVANWSPWWDLRIILGTIPAVLRGSGAS
jgi:exopolysaccharide biosynthesis polyprenyl glycosylphosphotransferase